MRLDKFLKVSRVIKRRTLAKEVCDSGRVMINGNPAKASSDVAVGDEIKIRFGQKLVTFEVQLLKETTRKEEADHMYRILSEESIEATDHQ
ncbi:RNA-binding S4 domain-containing protein [Caldalkalibacillus mannanilyticus]|uniref:RNA-binding S4 domain-containing protein n=1 Tax=Caldalkalibacillus mannanilyticus TaxID=1418 RepID=UPI00046A31D3|nr:RNA-binding S4 domain-containing protein [Caldalkalibacillus mannanilyticus]